MTPTGIKQEERKHERIRKNLKKNIRDTKTNTNLELQRKAAVLGPTACMWAAKLSQRNRCPVDAAEMKAHQGKGAEPPQVNIPDDDFQIIGEPLYGGKGKRSGLIYNQCDFPLSDTCDHGGGATKPEYYYRHSV